MFKVTFAKVRCCLLLLACFTMAGSGLLFAQGSGTITGFVTDPAGLAVPGAPVTITNTATGSVVKTSTNNAGVYQVRALNAGSYTIEVSASGFRTYVDKDVLLTTNQTLGIDVKLEVGEQKQTVTVESVAPLVNTEEGRVQNVVTGAVVNNLPLNGRNIYALMQLAPGAVDSTGIDKEAGAGGLQTNINGARANFNGFMLDGVSNKGLSGGSNDQPAPDFVQEYVIQSNNFSAEYSSSAGSITDVTTKAGTNQFHGDLWEFFRNDKLNTRNFFDGKTKSEWRQNQFGGTIGGPIKKDKLFFFGGYEGERFRTAVPSQFFVESPAFHQAVISALPNSVAALLYKNFPGPVPVSGLQTVADYIGSGPDTGDISLYTDPCAVSSLGVGSPAAGGTSWGNPQTVANNLSRVLGVTAAENLATTADIAANCPGMGFTAPGVQLGTIARNAVMAGFVNSGGSSRTKGVFYDGNKYTAKGDYQGETNRMSARWSFSETKDPNPSPTTGIRGFSNPNTVSTAGAAFNFVHTFSPTIVNEFRAGFTRSQTGIQPLKSQYGVPNIGFDTGEPAFGSYNGYPQFFNEDVFDFKDLVSIVKGKHSIKVGGELKKNYENSEFNVGRPSYYFFDQLYFAADLPYFQSAGVNPELTSGAPSHIDTNIRAWRNYEAGWFVQDDWKVSKRLTLNLGLRWDFFSPHKEKYNKATQLILGPGLANINCEAQVNSKCALPAGDTNTPNGGFAAASQLFPARYGNFAPRFGFAWDPFGSGTTALRGAAAISYEGTFYNALSNSRWNLPFYSFNEACPICGLSALPSYGPIDASGNPTGAAPTYTGAPTSLGNGPAGLGFQGNIMGWLPTNPNLAALTGIPSQNYKLPYVEQFFLGVQHQFGPNTVIEVNGVLNLSRHLFWAENPNRVVGGKQATSSKSGTGVPVMNPCTGVARFNTPLINPCFGTMRTWETSVNSSYSGLQISLNHKASHGLTFITNYTWSHSLDYRSTWHALTSAGSATDSNPFGEAGYSMDPNRLYLEHGNSLFDITHRLVAAASWDLPWMKAQNTLVSKVLGGWQANPDLSLQSGFPFTVGCHCDYNGDGIRSDRPNTPSFGNSQYFSHSQFENGALAALKSAFPAPTPGKDGTLGRNTFRGPGIAGVDFSLFKKIPISERFNMQFRTEVFNLFNHANLSPPVANLASSSFGKVQSAGDPREIQFGLKLFF